MYLVTISSEPTSKETWFNGAPFQAMSHERPTNYGTPGRGYTNAAHFFHSGFAAP